MPLSWQWPRLWECASVWPPERQPIQGEQCRGRQICPWILQHRNARKGISFSCPHQVYPPPQCRGGPPVFLQAVSQRDAVARSIRVWARSHT